MRLSCQEGLVSGNNYQEKFRNLEKWGFEGIEIAGGPDLREKAKDIEKAMKGGSVCVSTICGGEQGWMLSPGIESRKQAVKNLKEHLEIAANLGAVGTILAPWLITIPGNKLRKRIPDLYPLVTTRDLEIKLLVEMLKEVAEFAEKVGTLLLLEPLNRYECFSMTTLSQGIEICKMVTSDNVKIMADFFHMNIEERDIVESLKKAGNYVQHIHLADSNRFLPGYGHIDFVPILGALKEMNFQNYLALECRNQDQLEKEQQYFFDFAVPEIDLKLDSMEEELPKFSKRFREWISMI